MTKNPILNALAAVAYIALVASLMFYGFRQAGPVDTVLAPITMISLFTFSAAVMAVIFFYQPFQIYFDGDKKRGLKLFLQTLAAFPIITLIFAGLIFLIIH